MYNYIFSTKVPNFYDNSARRQFCSRRRSRHVICIVQIYMPCRLLVLHAPLYTNIVDRKSGPFGGNLDKNAKNWLEQGALAIFWHFLTPGNKWCLDWSWFQTIYPIPIFDILFPFPVTKSQSQWLKSHFPRAKTGQSQFPFYPFRTLLQKLKVPPEFLFQKGICLRGITWVSKFFVRQSRFAKGFGSVVKKCEVDQNVFLS